MAMRALKSTTIQFGMVVMPVKVYPATSNKSVGMFNQVHSVCGSRIRMPKTCPKCNRVVEAGEIVSGWSLGKVKGGEEKYIVVTDAELEALPLQTAVNIAIDGFVPKEKVSDPRWADTPYYLAPEETAVRPFVMFAKAMEASGKYGVAKVALKEKKEHLCIIRPFEGILMLQTLHWADELRDYSELLVSANVSDKELELAISLIGAMTKDINLATYQDEYRKAVLELVAAKQEGKELPVAVAAPKMATDMVDALLASLKMAGVSA